jgi:dTDP-4-dehydrorhamnose reductase
MKILVTGVSGQVGHELLRALAPLGEVVGADRAMMDLASPDAIRQAMRQVAPALVFNPGAYTAVDRAESEPELAMQVNGVAPGVLAEECARLGARLIHFSTDYVFDGTKPGPYTEDDAPAPASAYGRSKLAGEQAVAAVGGRHLILRTSWVYGLRGGNFLKTMFRLARERDELRVVDDQRGAPTTSLAIAQACALVTARWLAQDESGSSGGSAGNAEPGRPPAGEAGAGEGSGDAGTGANSATIADGVYHMTCAGTTTWCGFARAIVDRLDAVARALGEPVPDRRPRVTAIRTADFPTPARRPANSVLDNGKLARACDVTLPHWEAALDALIGST